MNMFSSSVSSDQVLFRDFYTTNVYPGEGGKSEHPFRFKDENCGMVRDKLWFRLFIEDLMQQHLGTQNKIREKSYGWSFIWGDGKSPNWLRMREFP